MKPLDALQVGAPGSPSQTKESSATGADRPPAVRTSALVAPPRTDYGRRTASFDEAIGVVARLAQPSGTERVDLAAASGRVLASPLIAGRTAPGTAVSAMDGYAVRDDDLACAPTRLSVVGRIFAGDAPPDWELPRGCCARVFTGAPMPLGADRVVLQEEAEALDSAARFARRPTGRRHVRAAGSDFRAGERLLDPGVAISPQALLAAAAADVATLVVHQRPRVSIVSTGDELTEPGAGGRRPGAIPESVSYGVAAMAEEWGADVVGRRRIGDERAALERAAKAALAEAAIVVTIGGASVGERDLAKAMFEPFGLRLAIRRVDMRPGKPTWIGRASGRIVVGLPGNPAAALVSARLFLAPLIAAASGRPSADAWRWRPMPLVTPLSPRGDRETFLRGRSEAYGAAPILDQDSSSQKALAEADLLIRIRPETVALAPGDLVEVLRF